MNKCMNRCFGCCQENCGYKNCKCACHRSVDVDKSAAKKLSDRPKLNVGDHVIDTIPGDGHEGIVVKIEPGFDAEDHGTVYVWQLNRLEYGVDNCEHFCEFGWEKSLKVLKKAGGSQNKKV